MKNRACSTLQNWIYAGVSLALFGILTAVVLLFPEIKSFDMSLLQMIQALLEKYPESFAVGVSHFGGQWCLFWPQMVAVTTLFSHRKYFEGILLVIFTQIAWHGTDYIKSIISRERPCGDAYPGASFPSSHSVTTMCFYGILVYLIAKYVKNEFWRYLLIVILSSFILIVGLSRMKLNVHFPIDVLAGYLLGFVLLNLYIIITKNFEK